MLGGTRLTAPERGADVGPERETAVAVAWAAAIAAVLFAPVFHRLVTDPAARSLGGNDYLLHLDLARGFSFQDLPAPHPVFHGLTWLLASVLGFATSAVVLMTLAVAAAAAALVVLARRGWGGREPLGAAGAIVFTIYALIAEPPELIFRAVGVLPAGTLAPTTHAWGSPTDTLMLPLLVVLLVMLVDALDDLDRFELTLTWNAGLVATVGTLMLVKPTFCYVLVVGLPLQLLVTGRWRSRNARWLVGLVAVPVVVISAWQGWFVATGRMAVESPGIRFAPLESVRIAGLLDVGPAFWVSHVAVAVVAVIGGRRYFRDVGVQLAGFSWIVSLFPLLLLQETGPSSAHGNLTKPAGAAWLALSLFTVRFVALELRDAWQHRRDEGAWPPLWSVPLGVFVALSLMSGAWVYLDTLVPG